MPTAAALLPPRSRKSKAFLPSAGSSEAAILALIGDAIGPPFVLTPASLKDLDTANQFAHGLAEAIAGRADLGKGLVAERAFWVLCGVGIALNKAVAAITEPQARAKLAKLSDRRTSALSAQLLQLIEQPIGRA